MNAALTASKVMQVFSRSRGTVGPPKMLLAWSNKLAMEIIRGVSKKISGFLVSNVHLGQSVFRTPKTQINF